jgi:hypothetical protein
MEAPQDSIQVAGKTYKFKFPSLRVAREAMKLGYKGNFGERWDKAESDDEEFKKMVDSWPLFVAAVIEGDVTEIDSLEKITYMEALSIDLGFTKWGSAVRPNSANG